MVNIATRPRAVLVATTLCLFAVVVVLALAQASTARAGSVGFCEGVTLPGAGSQCNNPSAVLTYQAYGWGENHSVCVWLNPYNGTRACSGGPNQGVYSGTITPNYAYPYIENNAAGANRVHGVYFN